MTIVAQTHAFVVGADTHSRTHALAIMANSGELLDERTFPATKPAMARALDWAARRTGGDLGTLWVIEGAATYGAQLCHTVQEAGYPVIEAPAMSARTRRGVGKSDPLDARRIAAAALPLENSKLRHPRDDAGQRAALRVLTTARDQMTREHTAAVNALIALARTIDLGLDARQGLGAAQLAAIATWRTRSEPLHVKVARAEAIRLARRIAALDDDLVHNRDTLTAILDETPARSLLDLPGIGAVTAAVVLTAWSHPGRVRSEAAFANLAGVSPVPASSGNTVRHRLNYGGDRDLNRALHWAVVTRMRMDPLTRAYVERRRAEGLTTKEIRRCLKRYLARQIHRHLTRAYAQSQPLDRT